MKTRTDEQTLKRCEFLESLGFKCIHKDHLVIHPNHDDLTLDFSTINMEVSDVISRTISSIYQKGRKDLQCDLKDLLGIKDRL